MPPVSKKNCSVVLYDFNTLNQEQAKNAALKIFAEKYFKFSKDVTKIFFTNVDKTSNKLHCRRDGYENIYEATDIVSYDPRNFTRIFDKCNFNTGKSDWLEALKVGIDSIKHQFTNINGIITRQLLFITDLSIPSTSSHSDMLKSITSDLNEYEIFLYIVGPNVKFRQPIVSMDDIETAMEQYVFETEDDTANLVKYIVCNTNTVIADYKVGTELFSVHTNPIGGQPWQVPLSFGTELEIPTFTIRLINKDTLKLQEYKPENPNVLVWVDAEDETVEIDFRDTIAGVSRYGKFIPMEAETLRMLKCNGPRRFPVLGFTDQSNVPEYLMRGDGTRVVIPSAKSPEKNNAVYVLIDKLYEKKMYVVVAQVYNANNRPRYHVLIPKPDYTPKCFFMVQLPYADDMRMSYVESKPRDLTDPVSDEVSGFLDSLDIHGSECQIEVPLTPSFIQNINDTKILHKSLEKYLDKSFSWKDVNIDLLNIETTKESEESLKNAMPELKVIDETKLENVKDGSDSEFEFQEGDFD